MMPSSDAAISRQLCSAGVMDHNELVMLRQAGVMESLLGVFQWEVDAYLKRFHDDGLDSLGEVDSGEALHLAVFV